MGIGHEQAGKRFTHTAAGGAAGWGTSKQAKVYRCWEEQVVIEDQNAVSLHQMLS